jgi:hypothetical protein
LYIFLNFNFLLFPESAFKIIHPYFIPTALKGL